MSLTGPRKAIRPQSVARDAAGRKVAARPLKQLVLDGERYTLAEWGEKKALGVFMTAAGELAAVSNPVVLERVALALDVRRRAADGRQLQLRVGNADHFLGVFETLKVGSETLLLACDPDESAVMLAFQQVGNALGVVTEPALLEQVNRAVAAMKIAPADVQAVLERSVFGLRGETLGIVDDQGAQRQWRALGRFSFERREYLVLRAVEDSPRAVAAQLASGGRVVFVVDAALIGRLQAHLATIADSNAVPAGVTLESVAAHTGKKPAPARPPATPPPPAPPPPPKSRREQRPPSPPADLPPAVQLDEMPTMRVAAAVEGPPPTLVNFKGARLESATMLKIGLDREAPTAAVEAEDNAWELAGEPVVITGKAGRARSLEQGDPNVTQEGIKRPRVRRPGDHPWTGQSVQVRRSSGALEDGWEVVEVVGTDQVVVQRAGGEQRKMVKRPQLLADNPALARIER